MREQDTIKNMKLIDNKSVLLGMGIGVIITAILGFIFFLGYEPDLSDAQIIERAKQLGMVDKLIQQDDIQRNPDGSVSFIIKEGESFTHIAERLYQAGIISSSIEFELMLKKENLQGAIRPGQYTISFNDDIKTIIQKITGRQ